MDAALEDHKVFLTMKRIKESYIPLYISWESWGKKTIVHHIYAINILPQFTHHIRDLVGELMKWWMV
jgi:hypothetical protein